MCQIAAKFMQYLLRSRRIMSTVPGPWTVAWNFESQNSVTGDEMWVYRWPVNQTTATSKKRPPCPLPSTSNTNLFQKTKHKPTLLHRHFMASAGKYVDDLKSGLKGTGFSTIVMHLLTPRCRCPWFLARSKMTLAPHSPCSPYLAPHDFFCFLKLKMV